MLKIIEKRNWFFLISVLIIVPGLVSLLVWGLNFGVDFTGGSLLEVRFDKEINKDQLIKVAREAKVEIVSVQTTGEKTYLLRSHPLEDQTEKDLIDKLKEKYSSAQEVRKETIGPTIGRELLQNALLALLVASVMIVVYISWAFRSVPKPASSLRFGICAIIALLHDALLLLGTFSLLGHFFAVEIDSLFVTAVLTVIGFSVHDTIVVFDRIRENLNKGSFKSFEETVSHSIMQTLGRSLNTSLTVILVLLALLLFGGSSIRWFVVALLIGITSGTYSSIFNAAPLLVVWQKWSERKK